jgi:thiol-disulfide isomerase/thioredoxin
MGSTRGAGMIVLAAAAVAMAAGAARAGDELPRYRLEPGMELSYKGSSKFRHQSGMHLDDQETTAWVVRRNADGSVRVVLRQGSRFRATSTADSLKDLFKKQDDSPMEYDLAYFDLSPDGRLGPDSELGYRIDPASLFPPLPADEAQGKAEWGRHDERMGREDRYTSLRPEPGGWSFRAERLGPEKKIYGMTMDATFHLDAARGVIARVEQEYAQDYGFKGKGTGSVELTGVETKDDAWLAAFAPAADRYFAASKAYERATEAASKDAERADALLADAKAALQSARDEIDQPIFREQLDRLLAKHESMAGYYADSAKRRAEVVGKPSADWSLEGLDGKTHALADYRGKVVVLDFWYRGCGWCIKAMPQMNALAGRFEGRPVAVLGMNTDRDAADARFVADAMGLKYATLRAQGIPEKYGVQGFPTLIIIDPQGVVRDVHVGYSPTLLADVAKVIEGLLPAETTATAEP